MKLSVSNIAWDISYNEEMYGYLDEIGFSGLEIAPTKIIPDAPYDQPQKSRAVCPRTLG